eukprot:scaffold3816_cov182-Alexandrium_tamarense.AAC.2
MEWICNLSTYHVVNVMRMVCDNRYCRRTPESRGNTMLQWCCKVVGLTLARDVAVVSWSSKRPDV